MISLDCPAIKPDSEANLLQLWPSYTEAMKGALHLLPSANIVDGAAKQFDDGLYAALDLACYRGELGGVPGAVNLASEIFNRLPESSPAKPFLAAALQLAGQNVNLDSEAAKIQQKFLADFTADAERSKPISFYTWTPELEHVWKFYRFLQKEFDDASTLDIPMAVAEILKADPGLMKQYQAVQQFYGRLTNPSICLSIDALVHNGANLQYLAKMNGAHHSTVAVFPPSTSRETELFERLFPFGLPENVELMAELIRRIRSGEVDLAPKPNDGWYQYQVHALECLLLPSKAQEENKLLLTARYKKRLVEAFKAFITKRRETHSRQLSGPFLYGLSGGPGLPADLISPRLRVEPCATVYLRTARAYAFLQNFLRSMVPADRLASLHGLKEGGSREPNLDAELDGIRQRFYGFYLVACEDIGMKPQFLEGEPVNAEPAKVAALTWLDGVSNNPDLACDTRAAISIYTDPSRGKARLWATLGVRLAHLKASYASPPKIRPQQQDGPWQDVPWDKLVPADMLIPVDEFAEVEVDASKIPNRAEFRSLCDKYKTKEAIVKALERL